MVLRPHGSNGSVTATQWLHLEATTQGIGWLQQSNFELKLSGRKARSAACRLRQPRDFTTKPPQQSSCSKQGNEILPTEGGGEQSNREDAHRCPNMQKAGRETGPECSSEQNWRPQSHRTQPTSAERSPPGARIEAPPRSFARLP
jgi:hypothetical protein